MLDPSYVEVLADPEFQRSRLRAEPYTLLDTCRLANLWTLCRQTNPAGAILEVGSYRGGAALHLANQGILLERSLIVLDDVCRNAEGVDRAIHEFLRDYSSWTMLPIFPSQGLLIPKGWFG